MATLMKRAGGEATPPVAWWPNQRCRIQSCECHRAEEL